MDSNGNPVKTGKDTYFQYEIHFLETVHLAHTYRFWRKIWEHLKLTTTPEPDILAKLERIHICDENWEEWVENEERRYECAAEFWNWATELMKKIGPYVKELHIEMASESENYTERMTFREHKVKFLSEMSEWFPNLKALKITGIGFNYGFIEDRLQYDELVEKTMPLEMEYVEIDKEVSDTHFRILAQKQLMSCSKLTDVHVSVNQLATPQHKCVLQHVKTIHLSQYGIGRSRYPETYIKSFVEQLPSVKHLFIVDTMNDEAPDLPEFVSGVHDILKLETFGIDQTARVFSNKNGIKITGIPVVRVDIQSFFSTLAILKEIGDTPDLLVYENWDLAKFRGAATPENIKRTLQFYSKERFPQLTKMTLLSSEGVYETIEF